MDVCVHCQDLKLPTAEIIILEIFRGPTRKPNPPSFRITSAQRLHRQIVAPHFQTSLCLLSPSHLAAFEATICPATDHSIEPVNGHRYRQGESATCRASLRKQSLQQ